jgi:predicted metal-dependent HD superfamily phosphohydrolase
MSSAQTPGSNRPPPALFSKLLKERFSGLWTRSLLPGADSDPETVWHALDRRYGEAHRRYHDKNHLAYCLDQLDLAGDRIEDPDRVEMAIWFHDVVNDPGRGDNEARSADMFRQCAHGVMDEAFVDAVIDLILVTTHKDNPPDTDHQFICDIDLASFGCPWECYIRDTARVKAEFKGPEEDYYRRKRAFLEGMLRRPKIFHTEFFNGRYERQARENIERLLDLMERCQD